jgi:dipeptidyl aminopeptidase/acylaminoacyl peptidase
VFTTDALATALADRYTIERLIGEGGMARVFLARDLRHNRRVALKVLRPDLGAVVGVERFQAEIEVTANLQHPNLLPLFDSGVGGDLLFYVMPYVEGESLRARIDREKQLPVDEALRIATAVAGALDYAHRHGVIHRDLKPENILLHDGQPLVADFGIALAISNASGARITQTGISLGTPQYMSPEQATGDRTIDARTDIYSLGALTYEMLTGEPPHAGSTSQAIIARVLTEKPRGIRAARPSVPVYVDATVEKALQKLPADRWTTAREFAEALSGTRRVSAPPSSDRRATRWMVGACVSAVVAIGAAVWALNLRAEHAELQIARQITFDGTVVGAAISPDGLWLAYVTADCMNESADCGRTLSVREVDGRNSVHLVEHWPNLSERIAWSPDEGTVAFAGSPDSSPTAVYIIDRLGGSPRRGPARGEVADLAFAVDGKSVAVALRADARPILHRFESATWAVLDSIVLADSAHVLTFAYSADGHRMLAQMSAHGRETLRLMDERGAVLDSLPMNIGRPFVRFESGGAALFFNGGPGVADNLIRLPIEGDRLLGDRSSFALAQIMTGYNGVLDVARSSGRIVFAQAPTIHEIRVLSLGAVGTGWRLLSHRTGYLRATAVMDSSAVIAVSTDNLGDNLYRYPLNGGGPQAITWSRGGADFPTLSPDGRHLLYSLTNFQTGTHVQMRMVDVSGGTSKPLIDVGYQPLFIWLSNRTFAVFRDGAIVVFDTTGAERSRVPIPDSLAIDYDYGVEGGLAAGASHPRVAFWSARAGGIVTVAIEEKRVDVLTRSARQLLPASFLPDGTLFAVESGDRRASTARDRGAALVRISPDGRSVTRVADLPPACVSAAVDPAGRRAVCDARITRPDVWLADKAGKSTW